MDFITAEMLDGLGVVALFVLLFWFLATGRLVTRREADSIAADRDMWRETAQTLAPDVAKVLTEAETTNRLLSRLPGISSGDTP